MRQSNWRLLKCFAATASLAVALMFTTARNAAADWVPADCRDCGDWDTDVYWDGSCALFFGHQTCANGWCSGAAWDCGDGMHNAGSSCNCQDFILPDPPE